MNTTTEKPSLFDPLKMGELTLRNRIIMAPLTRQRSSASRSPGEVVAQYYAQRASAGLILAEATAVTPMGVGYADTPGIWSDEQVEGWRHVTKAVHDAGGQIVLQLWHVGRISDPIFLGGQTPVSASNVVADGHVSLLRPMRPYQTPRPLGLDEISGVIAAYRKGAENAERAGFDGVEIHGANGYLPDQFLQDGTNQRNDIYGGSIENRARLMIEAVDAAIDVYGAGRVGLHLSPRGDMHDMRDSDPAATFGYVARAMNDRGIAFIMTREFAGPDSISPLIREQFNGAYIANENLDFASAQDLVGSGAADAAAFGKLFIANPDLVERFRQAAPLNAWNAATFYGSSREGYIDYPILADAAA